MNGPAILLVTRILASYGFVPDLDFDTDHAERFCAAVANKYPEYIRYGNERIARGELVSELAHLDTLCPNLHLSLPMKYMMLRHKVRDHHREPTSQSSIMSFNSLKSPLPIASVLRRTDLTGSLADLFEYHLFKERFIDGCRAFVFDIHQRGFSIDAYSACSSEQLAVVGQLIGLSVYFGIPLGKRWSSEFPSILLGVEEGWTDARLRINDLVRYHLFKGSLSQNRIDFEIFGRLKHKYIPIVEGFANVIPRTVTNSFIDGDDLCQIMLGDLSLPQQVLVEIFAEERHDPGLGERILGYMEIAPKLIRLLTSKHHVPLGGYSAYLYSLRLEEDFTKGDSDPILVDVEEGTIRIPSYSSRETLYYYLDRVSA